MHGGKRSWCMWDVPIQRWRCGTGRDIFSRRRQWADSVPSFAQKCTHNTVLHRKESWIRPCHCHRCLEIPLPRTVIQSETASASPPLFHGDILALLPLMPENVSALPPLLQIRKFCSTTIAARKRLSHATNRCLKIYLPHTDSIVTLGCLAFVSITTWKCLARPPTHSLHWDSLAPPPSLPENAGLSQPVTESWQRNDRERNMAPKLESQRIPVRIYWKVS